MGPHGVEVLYPPPFKWGGRLAEAAEPAFSGEVGGAAVAVLWHTLKREEDALERGIVIEEGVVEEVVMVAALIPVLLGPLPHFLAGLSYVRLTSGEVVGDVDPAGGAEEVAGPCEVGVDVAWGSRSETENSLEGGLSPVAAVPAPLKPTLPLLPVGGLFGAGVSGSWAWDAGVAVAGLWDGQRAQVFFEGWLAGAAGIAGLGGPVTWRQTYISCRRDGRSCRPSSRRCTVGLPGRFCWL